MYFASFEYDSGHDNPYKGFAIGYASGEYEFKQSCRSAWGSFFCMHLKMYTYEEFKNSEFYSWIPDTMKVIIEDNATDCHKDFWYSGSTIKH